MKKSLLLLILTLLVACDGKAKIDLFQLKLNEPIKNVVDFKAKKIIGVDTLEYPFSLLIELNNSKNYHFDGIDLSGQKIIFQVNSERLKTADSINYGGAHIESESFQDPEKLDEILKKYRADEKIYGVRIEMKDERLKQEMLKKLETKYGKGVKNNKTLHGLYWNLKNESKFVFYAPDYDRLIILNNTKLSKNCYWDSFNDLIDFGGCDPEKYTNELTKHLTKPKDIKNKPTITIDKNWNINGLIVGKSSEEDFINSPSYSNFQRTLTTDTKSNALKLVYENSYAEFYLSFGIQGENPENKKGNILNGYSIIDFKGVDIVFDRGLKMGDKMQDVVKIFDKSQIENYDQLKYSNYIEVKNPPYKVTLLFNADNLFSGITLLEHL